MIWQTVKELFEWEAELLEEWKDFLVEIDFLRREPGHELKAIEQIKVTLKILLLATPPRNLPEDLFEDGFLAVLNVIQEKGVTQLPTSPRTLDVLRRLMRLWFQLKEAYVSGNRGEWHYDSILSRLMAMALDGRDGDLAVHLQKETSLLGVARKLLLRPLLPHPFEDPDRGLVAVELLSPEDLDEEGRQMNHCLSRRVYSSIFSGENRFFSIRKTNGERVATLVIGWVWIRRREDMGSWDVEELRGPGNEDVNSSVKEFVSKLLNHLNSQRGQEIPSSY